LSYLKRPGPGRPVKTGPERPFLSPGHIAAACIRVGGTGVAQGSHCRCPAGPTRYPLPAIAKGDSTRHRFSSPGGGPRPVTGEGVS